MLAGRAGDLAASPWPKPGNGAEEQGFSGRRFADNEDAFALLKFKGVSLSMTQPAGVAT